MDEPGRESPADDEAARWVVRCDRGLDRAEEEALAGWFAADPAHRAAFRRHSRAWGRLDLAACLAGPGGADLPPASRRVPATALWLGAAAVLALAFTLLLPLARRGAQRAPSPAPQAASAYRRSVLEDGSVVELHADAEVRPAYTKAERSVLLVSGEAHFTVSKNPLRPFVVEAAGVRIRAVGTAFDVRLAGGAVSVLVTEGRVQVSREGGRDGPLLVPAGFRAEVPAAASAPLPAPTRMSRGQVERLLAWKPSLLDFEGAPLSQIVEAFNRGGTVRLVLADPRTAAVRMNLIAFDPRDVDTFVRLAEKYYGIQAERGADTIVLRLR